MGAQELLDKFYDIENLITVNITLPDVDWNAILNAEPKGKWGFRGSRFDWYKTNSVTVFGSKFPKQSTYADVGIIKKSFWGSFSKTKPSLKLDWGEFNKDGEDNIEKLIGTHRIILNNSNQDPSYIRQPLGYELFKESGIPSFRCNFAKVIVNDFALGLYINIEPMQKRFVENWFAGNNDGNAYEIEWIPDLLDEMEYIKHDYLSFEGFSDYEDGKDLKLAADTIAHKGIAGVEEVVDMDAFLRYFAMESLLKHWDGYTHGLNNTYLYNDAEAVADPTVDDVKLKYIPSGIDQILHRDRPFEIGSTSVLAQFVLEDRSARERLFSQIRELAEKIFGLVSHEDTLWPFVDRLEAMVRSTGLTLGKDYETYVNILREQLQSVKSAKFTVQGTKTILDLSDQ